MRTRSTFLVFPPADSTFYTPVINRFCKLWFYVVNFIILKLDMIRRGCFMENKRVRLASIAKDGSRTEYTRDKSGPQTGQNTRLVVHRPSILTDGVTIVGDISSMDEVTIHGKVIGDVNCTRIVVGETGSVTGELSGEELSISGRIDGTVRGEWVELKKSAEVSGDIHHRYVAMEAGTEYTGKLQRKRSGTRAK